MSWNWAAGGRRVDAVAKDVAALRQELAMLADALREARSELAETRRELEEARGEIDRAAGRARDRHRELEEAMRDERSGSERRAADLIERKASAWSEDVARIDTLARRVESKLTLHMADTDKTAAALFDRIETIRREARQPAADE